LGSSSWKARFCSTEPIASVTIGNDYGNLEYDYWREGKGQVIYFLKNVPFSVPESGAAVKINQIAHAISP
jgi:hypothetical protein